jgi:hypothetical protein
MKCGLAKSRSGRFPVTLALVVGIAAAAASAGTVTGTVRNGTIGRAAAGVELLLLQLQGGMQPVAKTKSDSDGHFKFDHPTLGTAPMLIRAVYRGVNYHEPVTPGQATADVEVFDPTDKTDAVTVTAHAIILQPNGADLKVGEIYNVENKTHPPLAYYRAEGSFLFSLPEGAQLSDVSAVGSSGMPVIQTTIDKGKNREAIAYAFRPGESGVRLTYALPYADNQAKLSFVSAYPAARFAIFAPPSVHISADGLTPAGQDQGFSVYMRESVAANSPLEVLVSGTAPLVQPGSRAQGGGGGDNSQNPSVNSRADSGGEAPGATATTLPARLDSLRWVLVSGFVAIFALGVVYLWRRPEDPAAAVSAREPAPGSRKKSRPLPASPKTAVAAELDRDVGAGLEGLKDGLFRLELRRQAGTIDEQEYARERARMEKLMRDLVKG